MRGHLSGDRELLPFPAGGEPGGNGEPCGFAVQANFDEGMPIDSAELDTVESFLLAEILALLGEGTAAQEAPQRTRKRPKVLR